MILLLSDYDVGNENEFKINILIYVLLCKEVKVEENYRVVENYIILYVWYAYIILSY